MAAMDSGVAGLLDSASSVDVTTTGSGADSGVDSSVDTTVDTGAETEVGAEGSEAGGESGEGGDSAELNADGKEKAAGTQKDVLDKDSKTPVAIRKQLKAWRDGVDANTPEGKAARAVVQQLHQSYERWNAAKELFPGGFSEMKNSAEFIKAAGGSVQEAQRRFDAISEVDQKLYNSADPADGLKSAEALVSDIVEDLKAEGKTEGLTNLTTAFLSSLEKNVGAEAFARVALPVIARGLQDSGAITALNRAWQALNSNDPATAKAALKGLGSWFKDVLDRSTGQKEEPVSAGAKKLAEEKAAFAKERESVAKSEVGKEANREVTSVLGKSLAPILKHPFIQALSPAAKGHIGSTILSEFYSYCQQDKSLQQRYKAAWAPVLKNSNDKAAREKLLNLNKQAVSDFAAQSRGMKVRDIVAKIYPQILKPMGPAAGRIAAAAASKTAAAKAAASGGPVQVASRPENLVREDVTIGGKFYSKSALETLQVTGKGFVKTATGFKLVQWRR